MSGKKPVGQSVADTAGMIVPAPLIVYLFGLFGVPLDPATAAGIGTTLTVLGSLLITRWRRLRA